MSLETTLARIAADDAERRWREHKKSCPNCTRYARQRQWAALCPAGRFLFDEHRAAQRELAENRRLDKLPAPGQETLFDMPPTSGKRT